MTKPLTSYRRCRQPQPKGDFRLLRTLPDECNVARLRAHCKRLTRAWPSALARRMRWYRKRAQRRRCVAAVES